MFNKLSYSLRNKGDHSHNYGLFSHELDSCTIGNLDRLYWWRSSNFWLYYVDLVSSLWVFLQHCCHYLKYITADKRSESLDYKLIIGLSQHKYSRYRYLHHYLDANCNCFYWHVRRCLHDNSCWHIFDLETSVSENSPWYTICIKLINNCSCYTGSGVDFCSS